MKTLVVFESVILRCCELPQVMMMMIQCLLFGVCMSEQTTHPVCAYMCVIDACLVLSFGFPCACPVNVSQLTQSTPHSQ